jgi:hypothetical protein
VVRFSGVGASKADATAGFADEFDDPPMAELSCCPVGTARLGSVAVPVGLGVTGTRLVAFKVPTGLIVLAELPALFDVVTRGTPPGVALPAIVVAAGDRPTMLVLERPVPPAEFAAGLAGPWPTGFVGDNIELAADRIAALVVEMELAAPASWGVATAELVAGVATPGD